MVGRRHLGGGVAADQVHGRDDDACCAGVPRKGAASVGEGRKAAPGTPPVVGWLDGVGPFFTRELAAAGSFGGCLASRMIASVAAAMQARTTTTTTSDQMRPRLDGCGGPSGPGIGFRSSLALRALRHPVFRARWLARSAADGSLTLAGPNSASISRSRRSMSSGPFIDGSPSSPRRFPKSWQIWQYVDRRY